MISQGRFAELRYFSFKFGWIKKSQTSEEIEFFFIKGEQHLKFWSWLGDLARIKRNSVNATNTSPKLANATPRISYELAFVH